MAGLLLTPQLAQAKPTKKANSEIETLRAELDELRQQLLVLERRLQVTREISDSAELKITATAAASADGFSINSKDGAHRLRFGGLIQTDAKLFNKTAGGLDNIQVRRAFIPIRGTINKRLDFLLQPDFGRGAVSLLDAYADLKLRPGFNLRAGKFKGPVGLERLQSAKDNDYLEPGFPSALVPNRDIGFQLSGTPGAGLFSWQASLTNGVIDGGSADTDTGSGKELALRGWAQPWKISGVPHLEGLGFGLAVTTGNEHGGPGSAANLPSYRTAGGTRFFQYKNSANATPLTASAWADGTRTRLAPQASWYWGPFGALAEWTKSTQEIRTGVGAGTVSQDITNKAWQLALSYVVTGEKASFTDVNPAKPFDPDTGGKGAWEIKGRLHSLQVDSKAFPTLANATTSSREANAWTLGVNWYLNKNAKILLDWENTSFKGGGGGIAAAPLNRPKESVFQLRTQLSF